MFGRCFQIETFAIGQQMNVGIAVNDLREVLAELVFKEAHDLSDALERKSFPAQLADHGDLGELVGGVHPAMALALEETPPELTAKCFRAIRP